MTATEWPKNIMSYCMFEGKDNHENAVSEHVELINGGKSYFDLLGELIDHAATTIHLYAYILKSDATGDFIIGKMIGASKRGVEVYIMADGYASRFLDKKHIRKLKESGIHFKFFNPIFSIPFIYAGRRLHQKVITIDHAVALVGGINIADRYNDFPEQKAWLDFALLIKGQYVKHLSAYCINMWKDNNHGKLKSHEIKNERIQMVINDWLYGKKEITETYELMFENAKKEIMILSSYFIPGRKMRKIITKAAKKGIRISVITASKTDVPITKHAEKWLYDWLLRNKIMVYEYKETILHGKIALCDETWMTIGSYNINNISAYASVELNINVRDKLLVHKTKIYLENIIKQSCQKITPEYHHNGNNKIKQFIRWCAYQFIRITLNIFTVFFPRKY